MFTRDYIELAKRSKGIQRNLVVQEVFGSQAGVARLLRVDRSAVNHIVWLRGRSERIEQFIVDEVKRRRADLLTLWQIPGNHREAA